MNTNDFIHIAHLKKMAIPKAWRGYGSTIFLEIGEMHTCFYPVGKVSKMAKKHLGIQRDGGWSSEVGDISIMIDGDWYISDNIGNKRSVETLEEMDEIVSTISNGELDKVEVRETMVNIHILTKNNDQIVIHAHGNKISYFEFDQTVGGEF